MCAPNLLVCALLATWVCAHTHVQITWNIGNNTTDCASISLISYSLHPFYRASMAPSNCEYITYWDYLRWLDAVASLGFVSPGAVTHGVITSFVYSQMFAIRLNPILTVLQFFRLNIRSWTTPGNQTSYGHRNIKRKQMIEHSISYHLYLNIAVQCVIRNNITCMWDFCVGYRRFEFPCESWFI